MYTVTFRSSCGLPGTTKQEIQRTMQVHLHALTQANVLCMARRSFVPVFQSGLKCRQNSTLWQDVAQCLATGEASAHDVAAWRAAELRRAGVNAQAQITFNGDSYFVQVSYPKTSRVPGDPRFARSTGDGFIQEHVVNAMKWNYVPCRIELPLKAAFTSSLFAADGSNRAESHATLQLYLDALTKANDILIATRNLPSIYDAGVRYQAEPAGVEDWYDILGVHSRKKNDCEDLASARTSELRKEGATARSIFDFFQHPTTLEQRYHCLTEFAVPMGGGLWFHPSARRRLDGLYVEDPSKVLGMRGAY